MITTYGVARTGYKLKSVEDIVKLKDYSVISSELIGTEYGPELHVNVKVGCEDGHPVIADYWIYVGSYGSCSYFIAKDGDFSANLVMELQEISHTNQDSGRKFHIGGNRYTVFMKPVCKKYDEQRVKQAAFWCLENHYTQDLAEIFSIVKTTEAMKTSPDEENCECDRKLTREEEMKISQAGADFYKFPKGIINKKQNKSQELYVKQYQQQEQEYER